MVFDPVSWAIGTILTATGKSVYSKAYKSLSSRLESIAEDWEKSLPHELRFNLEALFNSLESPETESPECVALGRCLESFQIPKKETWLKALLERWGYLHSQMNETRPFFTQQEEEALKHLEPLSERLEIECAKEQNFFQVTTYQQVSRLLENAQEGNQEHDQLTKDLTQGFDNKLISEITIAGYISEDSGKKRALYLDTDNLYVHRTKVEQILDDALRSFETQSHGQWLSIIGDAGQGKSSLLWCIFNKAKEIGVDVYCVLAQISGKNAITRLRRGYPLLEKKSVILLDTMDLIVGLDDAGLVEVINGIRQAGHLIVTSSRRQEIRKVPLRCNIQIELGKYTDEEAKEAINNYIRACYPLMNNYERGIQFENVWGILDARRQIQELDLEPLILSMIFQTYFPERIPQDIDTQRVYREFWEQRVLDDRTVLSDEDKQIRISLCFLISWSIASSPSGADSLDVTELEQIWIGERKEAFPHTILSRLVSSGILHWALGGKHVRFFHQTFLEYTAAVYVRTAEKGVQSDLVTGLLKDLDTDFFRCNPILKQIAVQAYHEGSINLCAAVLDSLTRIHSLHSLQIVLEIAGKIGSGGINIVGICRKWVTEDPSSYATTVCEIVKHYPKSKISIALQLLEPCLASHEEAGIYTLSGDKLALMDAAAVHTFLRRRLPFITSSSAREDCRLYFRRALIGVFSCGVIDALRDLLVLYPLFKGGQQAGLLSSLKDAVSTGNASELALFCSKIISSVSDSQQAEVRQSFTELLSRIAAIEDAAVKKIALDFYTLGQWRDKEVAALFTGFLVGRFLLDQSKISAFVNTIDVPEPHVRLLSTWALQQADHKFHEQILREILQIQFATVSSHARKMIFRVVASLSNVTFQELMSFLETCPWPTDEVLPDEFRRIFSTLADRDVNATIHWLLRNLTRSKDMQLRQLINGFIGLMLRDINSIKRDDLRLVYQIVDKNSVVSVQFASVAGLLAKTDVSFATEVFNNLLKSKIPNVTTSAIHSLKYSVNENLLFTLIQGDQVISSYDKLFGHLHCLVHVLRNYEGSEIDLLLNKVDYWFSDAKIASISDETTLIELLTFLKIYGKDHPHTILKIARRCPATSQGLCGALCAVYSNVAFSLTNPTDLSFILKELISMAKYHQRHIRNALRTTLPLISQKLGHEEVFKVFFAMYKNIESPAALETLTRALVSIPEWSHVETQELLANDNLPPQVKSVLLTKSGH